MKELLSWIQFWSAWFGFWGMILGLEIGLYQIAIADASKLLAKEFVSTTMGDRTLFGRAFFVTSQLADIIFGPRLLSYRAYWMGFSLSACLFAVAFAVAVGSNDNMSQGFVSWVLDWNDVSNEPKLIHAYTVVLSIIVVLSWLCLEPILAAKTRAFARLLRSTTPMIGVMTLLLTDLGSTLFAVILLSPLVFLCAAWLFLIVSSDMLNQHIFVLSSGETVTATFDEKPYFATAYRMLLRAASYDVFQHLRGNFHDYFVLEARGILDKGCTIQPGFDGPIVTGCLLDHSVGKGAWLLPSSRLTFPLTSMLVSSVATTIWMVSCAIALLLAKLISAPRRAFLWIHSHPLALWRWFIVPTTLVALAGGILLPLLLRSLFPTQL